MNAVSLYNKLNKLFGVFMEQQVISSDLIRGHIDTIILHTLLDGDKFPQQISDSIEDKSDKEYKINQATLYSSLKRLESLKYVRSYWNDSDNGRRKYYNLTESGKNTVESNLSNWSFSRAIIDKLMDCAPQPIYRTQYVEKIVEVVKDTSPATINNDIKTEEITVGYLAMIEELKGHRYLIEAAKILEEKPIKFLLMGSGSYEETAKSLVKELRS